MGTENLVLLGFGEMEVSYIVRRTLMRFISDPHHKYSTHHILMSILFYARPSRCTFPLLGLQVVITSCKLISREQEVSNIIYITMFKSACILLLQLGHLTT